jgi:hypothetical protein
LPFFYQSGEKICGRFPCVLSNKARDRIAYHGEPGEIEFVAHKIVGDSAMDWFVLEYSGGVKIVAEKFGPVFVHDPENEEDLTLVASQEATGGATNISSTTDP